ncbi:hypothetical protein B0G80_5445 [Paraburkholderia sp. BL6669N2]|nr:hypothetical protein B0G80_5445 [Paraburkholderia sp. BL6669N2]
MLHTVVTTCLPFDGLVGNIKMPYLESSKKRNVCTSEMQLVHCAN